MASVVTPVEEQVIRWGAQIMGWVVAGIAALLAWIIKTAIFQRLDAIERRMGTLETLAAAAVSHVELTRSVDGLRDEIAKTRLEIKQDVSQVVSLLRGH